jgi:hypothetical protein
MHTIINLLRETHKTGKYHSFQAANHSLAIGCFFFIPLSVYGASLWPTWDPTHP